ncbi:hypothetical protein ACLB2K_066496 [Fragaria x ananassa]
MQNHFHASYLALHLCGLPCLIPGGSCRLATLRAISHLIHARYSDIGLPIPLTKRTGRDSAFGLPIPRTKEQLAGLCCWGNPDDKNNPGRVISSRSHAATLSCWVGHLASHMQSLFHASYLALHPCGLPCLIPGGSCYVSCMSHPAKLKRNFFEHFDASLAQGKVLEST